MKIITPSLLVKLRKGAQVLFEMHQENLADQWVTIREDIAIELGLLSEKQDIPEIPAPENIFGEAEIAPDPIVMARVKLVDYIEGLKNAGSPKNGVSEDASE